MTAWFAHSIAGHGTDTWEPLAVHLRRVAEATASRAAKLGAADLGHLAGLLHDLGKYDPAFQSRLRGSTVRVDHAAPGAALARGRYRRLGTLLAHVVAGHHTGLRDGTRGPDTFAKPLDERLAPEGERASAALQAAIADGVTLPDTETLPTGLKPRDADGRAFSFAFFVRMLFSCLVDADYVETERFYGVVERGDPTPLTALRNALEVRLAALTAKAAREAPGLVNALRAEVLSAVRAKAGGPQGVFTLTVPTGGGKTLASLAFALDHAVRHGLDRVIVVIPFTSIVEQTAAAYREALGALGGSVLEHHGAFDTAAVEEREAREKLDLAMENWDARIVVTTAVQFFESLFADRTARCRKLHNIARSVVVLDEAQTLPLPLLRPAVAALDELARNYRTSVVLCTATQPALAEVPEPGQAAGFPGGFRAVTELAPDPADLARRLRRVRVDRAGSLSDEALASRLAETPQMLCIVNTRRHARALFGRIAGLPGARHLSTLMCPVHRGRVLAVIRADLASGLPCRLVSTSLVEAGVDLDFPAVMRAEAGLDSIAQAAGRCNREGRRAPGESRVTVFEVGREHRLRALAAQADAGRRAMDRFDAGGLGDDLLGPPAIAAYFRALYAVKGPEAFDEHRILELIRERFGTMLYPFETVARLFRMIDETMLPIIVPYEPEVADIAARLPFAEGIGGLARRLQRFIVGVPPHVRAALVARGAARMIAPERFKDQFVLLADTSLYREDAGLDWSDPTFMAAADLVG